MSNRAYVLIEVAKGQADTVAAELNRSPGVMNVNTVFGRYDVVALIEASEFGGLAQIVRNTIAEADHVLRTETLVLSSVSP
jgi:DNA-binding Lrp family transcriptional regulator